MNVTLDNLSYRHTWHDCYVDHFEGYRGGMVDFHAHDYYEISLILSGYVKVFLDDRVQEGDEARLVLTGPNTPHFISRREGSYYHRINLLFSKDFLFDYVPEWGQLASVFGRVGRIFTLSKDETDFFTKKIKEVETESEPFRRRLLILALLSHIRDLSGQEAPAGDAACPHFVTEAMIYLGEHYAEKILAADLACHVGVSRTTLMTAFKKYTGTTIGDCLLLCRIKHARRMLRLGHTQIKTAEACGFGDTCSLLRAFQKVYGMTPRQFLKAEEERQI